MKHAIVCAVVLSAALAARPGAAQLANDPEIRGDYVEARTAEVFTGGCIMGSEGEVSGREAIMAWRVKEGSLEGVPLNGLSVVAVVAGDVNLGTHELGGVAPKSVKAIVMTDKRATPAQQRALVAMAQSLAPAVVRDIVDTRSTPIDFRTDDESVHVTAGPAALDVALNVEHSPVCGALKWFGPLARTDAPQIGLTRSQEWSGTGLGSQWKQFDKKSSFFGSFTLRR